MVSVGVRVLEVRLEDPRLADGCAVELLNMISKEESFVGLSLLLLAFYALELE